MSMSVSQSYKNHTRWDPLFHFFIAPILLINIGLVFSWHLHQHEHALLGAWAVLVSVVLFMLAGKARGYALKVQDRVIRVEERIRLAALCSPAELAELESLTMRQYIALRFASNAELPELARRAVRENLNGRQIKEAIVSWRPDNDRV